MRLTQKTTIALILTSLLIISGCDQSPGEDSGSVSPITSVFEKLPANTMLEKVPADTLFFTGSVEPFPISDFMKWYQDNMGMMAPVLPDGFMAEMAASDEYDGLKMLTALYADQENQALTAQDLQKRYGMGETVQIATYTIGLLPVMRWSMANPAAFDSYIDALEMRAGVTSAPMKDENENIRLYQLEEGEGLNPYLVIARIGSDAVISIDLVGAGERYLDQILGKVKPEKSLAQTGRLQSMMSTYQLKGEMLGFLDHQQIIESLISTNTLAGQMLSRLEQADRSKDSELAVIRSPGCRSDIRKMASNWPQTVLGFTNFDIKPKSVALDGLMVVEVKNQKLLKGLMALNGFIPQHIKELGHASMAALGVGLNVNQLTPFVNEQWNIILEQKYECEPLKEFQKELAQQSPAALGVVAAMANGAWGASITINDVMMDHSEKGPESIDAIVTISADNPRLIYTMLAGILPNFKGVRLPEDSSSIAINLPGPSDGLSAMIAVKGKHLVLYSGEKGTRMANALESVPLSSNGVWSMNLDYGRYGQLLSDVVPDTQDSQDAKQLIDYLKSVKIQESASFDFTDRGLEFTVQTSTPQG